MEFFTAGEYPSLTVRFQDKTDLHFVIEPGFTLQAQHSNWKTGERRLLKEWPLIRSQRL